MKLQQEDIAEQGGDTDIFGYTVKDYTKSPEEFNIRIEFKNPLLISSGWEQDRVTVALNQNMMFSENTELEKISRKRFLKVGVTTENERFVPFNNFLPP